MLLPRAALALSCAAVTLMSGCGVTSTATDPATGPSMTIPSDVGATTGGPAGDPSGPSSAPSASGAASEPPTPAATPSAAATPSPAAGPHPGTLLDFHGVHLLLPVGPGDLPGIPATLRQALAQGLTKRWDAYGDDPACQTGPVYVINKVDTGGWAAIDSWDDPSVDGAACTGIGGGYTGFWATVSGTWQEVIGTQELPACTEFARYRFPVSIVGNVCADAAGNAVAYGGS